MMANDGNSDVGGGGEGANQDSDPVADMVKLSDDLLLCASECKQTIRKANPDSDPAKNFTWENFFTVHCGILPSDARKYEEALIAHRLDPLDTLGESMALIIKYGRIPLGDKLKISKTIQAKEKDINSKNEAMQKARESIGLENYSDLNARMILNYAGGDSEYHIDYGIERIEDGMAELERVTSIQMIKDPRSAEMCVGATLGRMMNDPTLQFLQAFGYETFEYTKGKCTKSKTVVHNRPTTSDPVLETLLLGNMTESRNARDVPDSMYS